jgi:hypothetical protein
MGAGAIGHRAFGITMPIQHGGRGHRAEGTRHRSTHAMNNFRGPKGGGLAHAVVGLMEYEAGQLCMLLWPEQECKIGRFWMGVEWVQA